MTDYSHALSLLRRAIDDESASFHEGQWEAIDALVNRRERLLVVQRTGWGKSLVYFIATRILRDRGRGPTLIVSPLLALMRDQMRAADRIAINALTINSTNQDEWPELQRKIQNDQADALLISPERLANDDFAKTVLMPIAEKIGLLVVDEAHCISDWGHDFRPDYRRLVNVLKQMPDNVAVLGTTATANNRVIKDVQTQLGDIGIQRGSLMRDTLALQTLRLPTQAERLAWLSGHINEFPGTGIIYTLTKRDADQVSEWLNQNDIAAKPYYSDVTGEGFGDSSQYREHLEELLSNNKIKALVATTALGMGYDKPDLEFVVHYQAPGSIVAYYQQVGRAGRAIAYAVGVLMAGDEDNEIHEYFRSSAIPNEEWVTSILAALEGSDGLTTRELEQAVNLRTGQIEKVLKLLSVDSPAPVLKDGSTWRRTPVRYTMDRERIARLTQQREIEWAEIETYVDESGCLMEFLARALDDERPKRCGKCASCLGRPIVSPTFSHKLAVQATRFLRKAELPFECKKQVAKDSFPKYKFAGNLPTELRAETGRVLSRWRDAGWGQEVAKDKSKGRFRDELVDAVVEMIRDRWKPNPAPTWVTCIPSKNHPILVPDFAERLASKLGLEFIPVITKVKDNEPQKKQQNRFRQCANLDGVFKIVGALPKGPVLLVDDIVDSCWTMTVAGALLKSAGSGPVWPLALATASLGN